MNMSTKYKLVNVETNEVRRLRFDSVPSWTAFLDAIKEFGAETFPPSSVIKYQDEESDLISISSQPDWEEANLLLSSQDIKRLFIHSHIDRNSTNSLASNSNEAKGVGNSCNDPAISAPEAIPVPISSDGKPIEATETSSSSNSSSSPLNLQELLESESIKNLIDQFSGRAPDSVANQLPNLLEMIPGIVNQLGSNLNNLARSNPSSSCAESNPDGIPSSFNPSNSVQDMLNQFLGPQQIAHISNYLNSSLETPEQPLPSFLSSLFPGSSEGMATNESEEVMPIDYTSELKILSEMGFIDEDTNKQLLQREGGSLPRVINILVQGFE